MSGPARQVLPLSAWPENDRIAWEAAIRSDDVLEEAGVAGHLSVTTKVNTMRAYGRFLLWLQRRNELYPDVAVAARATRQVISCYVTTLRVKYASSSVGAYLASLVVALKAMEPGQDWTWLRKIVSTHNRTVAPARDKWPQLIPVSELVSLGHELMDRADEDTDTMTWERATAYRDGLMICLLASRPLRRRNFCTICLGKHLIQAGEGYILQFVASETKNKRPLTFSFPGFLVPRLERYLLIYRPWLIAQNGWRDPRYTFRAGGDALWIAKTGGVMEAGTILNAVRRRTKGRFGVSLTLHIFRDCVATTIAIQDPGHVEIIQSLLGHADPTTTEKFYTHAHAIEASRLMQENVMRLRGAKGTVADAHTLAPTKSP